jgi:hypothetical protein
MARYILLLILLIGTVAAFSGARAGGDDKDSDYRALTIEFNSSCEENLIVVKDQEGDPVNQAEVDVFDYDTVESILNNEATNESGMVTFEGCGKTVKIIATKSIPSHLPYTIIRDLISCGECGCETNEDCLVNETCVQNECVPVECECGEVKNHLCFEYECCSNDDCEVGQKCLSNECEDEPECSSDSDCGGSQFCSNGECEDLAGPGCGIAANHTWLQWECDRKCPCPADEYCIEHECLKFEIDPKLEDDEIVVDVPEKCRGCGIDVVDPEGDKSSYPPDADGEVRIPAEKSGQYLVALSQNRTVFDKEDVDVQLPDGSQDDQKDFLQTILDDLLLWIAILVAIAVIALLYMIGRQREEPKAED